LGGGVEKRGERRAAREMREEKGEVEEAKRRERDDAEGGRTRLL